MIAAVEQTGCRYMFVFIKKNPKRAYINVIQDGRIYPFVIVAIDRIGNIAKAVSTPTSKHLSNKYKILFPSNPIYPGSIPNATEAIAAISIKTTE